MKITETVFSLPGNQHITVKSSGVVTSNVKVRNIPRDDYSAREFNAAIDGLESLLLALASAGVDVSTPEYHRAVEVAVESIGNEYP